MNDLDDFYDISFRQEGPNLYGMVEEAREENTPQIFQDLTLVNESVIYGFREDGHTGIELAKQNIQWKRGSGGGLYTYAFLPNEGQFDVFCEDIRSRYKRPILDARLYHLPTESCYIEKFDQTMDIDTIASQGHFFALFHFGCLRSYDIEETRFLAQEGSVFILSRDALLRGVRIAIPPEPDVCATSSYVVALVLSGRELLEQP